MPVLAGSPRRAAAKQYDGALGREINDEISCEPVPRAAQLNLASNEPPPLLSRGEAWRNKSLYS